MSAVAHAETNRVVLHGRLKDMFGGPFDIGINSPLEAVQALCLMLKGFRGALSIGSYRVIYGQRESGMELSLDQVALRLGHGNEVHFIPEAAGSGRGMGVGKIILGIALVGFAFFAGPGVFPVALGGGVSITASSVALFGVSMILNGISTLFAPSPSNGAKKKQESFLISGSVNSVGQGQPVPLCYGGPIRAGSTVISLSYTVADIPLNFKGNTDNPSNPGSPDDDGPTPWGGGRTGKTKGMTSTGSLESAGGEEVGGGEWSGSQTEPVSGG